MIGQVLAKRYRIDAEIGHGGMGVVYRGYDTVLKRIVAIKVISVYQVGEQTRERLLSEAQAVARLNHPNIVTVYDAVEHEGTPFIVMEFAEGGVLRFKTLPGVTRAIEYVLQICSALSHAHAKGIIHRDIKPDNVLLSPGGVVKLTDFGLALNMDASQAINEDGIVGTLAYMAPEIIQGSMPSPQSDIYALGVLFYEILTGAPPFQGADVSNLLKEILMGDLMPPTVRNPAIPPMLNALVLQLLQRDPDARLQSAQAVADALVAIKAERPGSNPHAAAVKSGTSSTAKIPSTGRKELDKDWRRKSYPKSSVPVLSAGERQLILANRAKELSSCLAILEQGHLLVITGMPGIGKSTLARVLLEVMPPNSQPPFWYDFDRQKGSGNSLGVVLDRVSSYLEKCLGGSVRDDIMSFRDTNDQQASASDVDVMTDYLSTETPLWLVFDNIETVLEPGGNGFIDPGLDELFNGLKSNTHNAKIIITSPLVPVLSNGEFLLEFGSQPLTLQGLDQESAVQFLRANGLEGFDPALLASVVQMVDGHPFALKHVARYISAVGIETVGENLRGGLDDFLEHFQELLSRRLSSDEYAVLKSLSVLQRAIPMEGLCKTAQTRPAMIKRLRDAGLLEKNQSSNFWLPTLVRLSLGFQDAESDRSAHLRALDYYRKLPVDVSPKEIDDFANVFEWHYHAVQSLDMPAAAAAIFSTGLDEHLENWNEYYLLTNLCDQVLTGLTPDHPGFTRVNWVKLNHILGKANFYLRKYARSEVILQAALDGLVGLDEPALTVNVLNVHAEALNGLGLFARAQQNCEKIFAILSQYPDDFLYAKALALRGLTSRAQREYDRAIEDLTAACNIYKKLKHDRQYAYSTCDIGIIYGLLNQFDASVEYFHRSLKVCEQIGDVRGVMINHLDIGDVLLQQELYQQACGELSLAFELARGKKLYPEMISAGLYLAEAQIALGLYVDGQKSLDDLKDKLLSDGAPSSAGHVQRLRAALEWRQGHTALAHEYFRRAFILLQGDANIYEKARAQVEWAAFLRHTNQLEQARSALEEALQGFIHENNRLGQQTVEKAMLV
jgi:serine/threonine protein kinase/tetratricopeptide (TPR) repeat protein